MIRNKVRTIRENKGEETITKAALARKIKVSRSYITKLEKESVVPSLRIAFRISEYFGCKIEDLFQHYED